MLIIKTIIWTSCWICRFFPACDISMFIPFGKLPQVRKVLTVCKSYVDIWPTTKRTLQTQQQQEARHLQIHSLTGFLPTPSMISLWGTGQQDNICHHLCYDLWVRTHNAIKKSTSNPSSIWLFENEKKFSRNLLWEWAELFVCKYPLLTTRSHNFMGQNHHLDSNPKTQLQLVFVDEDYMVPEWCLCGLPW